MPRYPQSFENITILTPDMPLGERALEALDTLHANGFAAGMGLSEHHLPAISAMTTEDHIVEFCPNDEGRLGSHENAGTWVKKGGGRGMVNIFDVINNNGQPINRDRLNELADKDLEAVAYGWSGFEENVRIPGADITTAYRVGTLGSHLARERRERTGNAIRLGICLGELVIATPVAFFDVDPRQISLETWQSNSGAVKLYKELGFVLGTNKDGDFTMKPDERPTLKPVGTVINGHTVYRGKDSKGRPANMVADTRLYKVLADHPLLKAA